MFLKRLILESDRGVIRDVKFSAGLNLIVDDTPEDDKKRTGNNVGKTTVLKLINYCLGGDMKEIFADTENKKASYQLVENFLQERKVEVTLELVDSLAEVPLKKTTIRRNFLKGRTAIREINGRQVKSADFDKTLGAVLMPQLPQDDKPTFRQAISHNVRYSEQALSSTLHTLDRYTRNVEYEALYLFMFGCPTKGAAEKQNLAERRKAEERYLKQLENGWTLHAYQTALDVVVSQIEKSEQKIAQFGAEGDSRGLIEEASEIEGRLSSLASAATQTKLRITIIEDAEKELLSKRSGVDVKGLGQLYQEVSRFVPTIQKTFEELVQYHNSMIEEKARFIAEELPSLRSEYTALEAEIGELSARSENIRGTLSDMLTDGDLQALIEEQNELFHRKGEYDARIEQLKVAQDALEATEKAIDRLDEESAAGGLEDVLQKQVTLFNEYFADVSEELYGETYVLTFEKRADKLGTSFYYFYFLDPKNISSGKKQGEMLCFDIAYTAFADAEGIDCLHFLLNDKKELMHGNQLSKAAKVASDNNVQLIVPILSDKVPPRMRHDGTIVMRLSQESKLFKIEELG